MEKDKILEAQVSFSESSSKRDISEFKEMQIDLSQVSANSKRVLNSMDIEERMEEIQSLSEQIVLRRRLPQESEEVKPGHVYIFEVIVECGSKGLIVTDKVNIFFLKVLLLCISLHFRKKCRQN